MKLFFSFSLLKMGIIMKIRFCNIGNSPSCKVSFIWRHIMLFTFKWPNIIDRVFLYKYIHMSAPKVIRDNPNIIGKITLTFKFKHCKCFLFYTTVENLTPLVNNVLSRAEHWKFGGMKYYLMITCRIITCKKTTFWKTIIGTFSL